YQPRSLLELDHRHDIRQVVRERRDERLVGHRPGIEHTPTADGAPLPALRCARAAEDPRRMTPPAASVAALEAERAGGEPRVELGGEPVRARRDARREGGHRSLRRMARLPSPKSPQPVTRPSRAPGTCASPACPRSCRTASITWFMPHMWPCESSPPCVFSGYRPPSSMAPSRTKPADAPGAQRPSASSWSRTT